MSLIFGFPNTRGIKVSTYLSALGINVLRCALSAFECIVTVSSNQPAYRAYTSYLPAYMRAWVEQRKISVNEPFHPIKYESSTGLVTTKLPNLSISFPNNPPAELLDMVRSEGGKDMIIKGKKILLLSNPTSSLVRKVVEAGAEKTTPAASGSANIATLSTLNLVRRIFSCFYQTHQYPAFADIDHLDYTEAHWIVDKEFGKRKATEKGPIAPRKKTRSQTAEGSSTNVVEEEEMEVDEPVHVPTGSRIIYAVPPPKDIQGWGDDSGLPINDGLFLRFVEETQNGEGDRVILDVLVRYFLGCLGPNAEAIKAMVDKLKGDLGLLISTEPGKELSHMAKAIDIGLQAQARIFPVVIEGQYLGSALLGAGFQIHAYGASYTPVSSISLQKQVEQAGSHKSALISIRDVLGLTDEDKESDDILGASTSLELREAIRKISATNETRDRIVQLARMLRFKPKSWNVSTANLTLALSLIKDPNSYLPDDFPVHPTKYFEEDRLSLVWAAFGDLAPSPNFPGGAVIDLTTSKDLPKHIGMRLIDLKDALVDMQLVLSSKKFCGTTLNRRSGPFKDRLYTGMDGIAIISALAQAAGVEPKEKSKGKDRAVVDVGRSIMEDGY